MKMSLDYVTTEVKKIIEDKNFSDPLNKVMAAAWIMGNSKGINLKVLDLRQTSTIADFFVIGSASNPTQMSSMAEEISHQMRINETEALSREGLKQSTDWILLDYGDFMAHVFSESARTIYDLDNLYKNAIVIDIPDSYYFSSPDESRTTVINDKDYF
jgi:ribosome-associated protein